MSFLSAKYFPMISYQHGGKKRDENSTFNFRRAKIQVSAVPDFLGFSNVSDLLRASFKSGNINGDDVKKWAVRFLRTQLVSIHLCNPSVWHSVGTRWVLMSDLVCICSLESLRPNVLLGPDGE